MSRAASTDVLESSGRVRDSRWPGWAKPGHAAALADCQSRSKSAAGEMLKLLSLRLQWPTMTLSEISLAGPGQPDSNEPPQGRQSEPRPQYMMECNLINLKLGLEPGSTAWAGLRDQERADDMENHDTKINLRAAKTIFFDVNRICRRQRSMSTRRCDFQAQLPEYELFDFVPKSHAPVSNNLGRFDLCLPR